MFKNLFKLSVVFIFMLLSTAVLFAQTGDTAPELPDNLFEVFTTFLTLVAVIPVVMEFLKTILKKTEHTSDTLVLILSWVTGIVVTMFGWFFQLGFLAGIEWYYALLYGFGASLAANGVADTKIIQWIFSLLIKKN